MNKEELVKRFSDCYLQGDKIIVKSDLKKIINIVKDEYKFDMLKQIAAIDNQNDGIELIYHLYSFENDKNLYISYTVFSEAETVTDIFKSAIADENEIYDLFGVIFKGNENLKRLYLPQSWEGYPLRKDYVQDDTRLAWNGNNEIQA